MANRINPNGNSGLTNKQKWALEQKAKQGWKCYFIEREYIYQLQETRDNARVFANQLRQGEIPDITYLTQQFLTLYDKVGELCDCPVCFETLIKENTTVPICGHLVCKSCKERMTDCPICRKKY
jgi:hypothetical protein